MVHNVPVWRGVGIAGGKGRSGCKRRERSKCPGNGREDLVKKGKRPPISPFKNGKLSKGQKKSGGIGGKKPAGGIWGRG